MRRIPGSTYRLQFRPGFGFDHARSILSYLHRMGVTDIYASPILRPRPGSEHCYDVVDAGELNPELGGEAAFKALWETRKALGMGWVQDIVPNHMAFHPSNAWLNDVLESGRESAFADFFDIDWDQPDESLHGRLLVPALGRFYGHCLEDGEIRLGYDEHGFFAAYFEHRYPLAVETYDQILGRGWAEIKADLGEENPDYVKLLGVRFVVRTLASGRTEPEERRVQIGFVKRVLWELVTDCMAVRRFVDRQVEALNGVPGDPASFDRLEKLLQAQNYRLAFWKVGAEEINYRRFFNINDLISLRQERAEVFEATHRYILDLLRRGAFTGLRVDHVDGLYDPQGYLTRLRQAAGQAYLVVEKILERSESLPANWPVDGTTGYDFLNAVNGVFVRRGNQRKLRRLYADLIGRFDNYQDLVCEKKRLITGKGMAGDVSNLAQLVKRVSGHFRHGRDITLYGLRRAIVELLANFPVYRTYFKGTVFSNADRKYLEETFRRAKERVPALKGEFEFISDLFLSSPEDFRSPEERELWRHLVMRFQQFTGPLMAKGFEDTLLYVYNVLLSLNDVGGAPDAFGMESEDFYFFCRERSLRWPRTMNATATHDTKRGEDVRARLNVLSEIPDRWAASVKRWRRANRKLKAGVNGRPAPDDNDEYYLYQTLIGAWPFNEHEVPGFLERLAPVLVKSVREAKVHTAWLKPDQAYEEAYVSFAQAILTPARNNHFLSDFLELQRVAARYGVFNSLSQSALKLMAPGVPDIYQGAELWDLSLVDPDNRRPVDFELRARILDELEARGAGDLPGLASELLANPADGRVKLFLIWRCLTLRRSLPLVFERGDFLRLKVEGRRKKHVLALARREKRQWVVCAVPRFTASLADEGGAPVAGVWEDTALILPRHAPARWRDAITGREVDSSHRLPLAELLAEFPVAVLSEV
ncbi:MAG: malto-oligosyltrehalose synthase [Thermodesulfobacteriota bacterium]|nr:malto-oligosyltrehalose synthase [Thermodesulfobacteriota bacterium]